MRLLLFLSSIVAASSLSASRITTTPSDGTSSTSLISESADSVSGSIVLVDRVDGAALCQPLAQPRALVERRRLELQDAVDERAAPAQVVGGDGGVAHEPEAGRRLRGPLEHGLRFDALRVHADAQLGVGRQRLRRREEQQAEALCCPSTWYGASTSRAHCVTARLVKPVVP